MVSNTNIIKIAKEYKKYVEKNKKTPSSITINETAKYNTRQCAYLFASFIKSPTSDVEIKAVGKAEKSNGDSISENVLKADYIDMASRLLTYINKNKKLPNYVTTQKSKKKVKVGLYIYAFAKIVVFYSENKKLPNYVTINSSALTGSKSTSSNLKPYMTSQGCSGMGQCTGYYCACNSLQQCFYRLTGIQVAESTIASVAGTTTSGTGHPGIETAVAWFNKKYNKKIKITWKNFSDLGTSNSERWSKLQSYINKGAVFCHLLYRDQWGHYEVPKNVSNENLSILNSLGSSCGGSTYCGYIETRSRSTQLRYMQGISQKSIAILTKE